MIDPAVSGLIGVALGGFVSLVGNYFLKTRETKLRVMEKILEKRIAAHEDILKISQLLRSTVSTNKISDDKEILTYPGVIHSYEFLESFKGQYYECVNRNVHWINVGLFRELNYVQDYIGNLSVSLEGVESENYPKVGIIIKEDILELSSAIEKEVHKFFQEDVFQIKIISNKGYHKLSKEESLKRLSNTMLNKKYKEFSIYKNKL